ASVQWVSSRGGLPQILLWRGPVLDAGSAREEGYDVGEEDFVLSQIEDVQPPEWQLVQAFHRAWGNASFQPSKAELDLARELIGTHGQAAVEELLPLLVKR